MLPCPCGGLKAPLVASLQESGAMQSCGEVTLNMSRMLLTDRHGNQKAFI